MSDEDGLLPDFDLLAIKVSGGIIENAHLIFPSSAPGRADQTGPRHGASRLDR